MSATKSRPVIGYDREKKLVMFDDGSVQDLRDCTKNEVNAVAKYLGIRFIGAPPVWFSPKVVEDAIVAGVTLLDYDSPVCQQARARKSVAQAVTPTPPTVGSSLDSAVQLVVHNAVQNALAQFKAGVDKTEVQQLVGDAVNTLFSGFKHEVTRQIDSLRPQVTNITVANRSTVQIKGVLHNRFADILKTVGAGVHAYLVGSAGTGKSTIGKQVAEALGVPFACKSVSGQTPESALVGFIAGGGNYVGTEFRRIFEHGGVFLLDEVDNGNPNVLNVLNSALANDAMAFADGMVSRHPNFVAIATANTYGNGATAEYVGRNPIDRAFLNRFATIEIEIDDNVEDAMLNSVGLSPKVAQLWITAIRKARANVSASGLRVLVTPRNTLNGARQIGAGLEPSKAFATQITAGLNPEQASKVLAGITLH